MNGDPLTKSAARFVDATFVIPSRFHPPHSLLGRSIRAVIDDPRRAESLYIVVVTLAAAALLLSQFLAWTALQPISDAGLRTFALVETAAAVLFVATCLIGRQAETLVRVDDEGLQVERAGQVIVIPFVEMDRISAVDAALYYRHFARYRVTRPFVNRIHPQLLMIETASGPVILGPRPSDLPVLRRILEQRAAAAYSTSRAGAA